MDEQNKVRIIFTPKANSVLESIIKSFNLEESPDEFLKKAKENKPSNLIVIDRLARGFAGATVSEKSLIDSLQKDVGVPRQTAEKLAKEIINNLVPLLEKFPGSETGAESIKKDFDIFPNVKPQMEVKKSSSTPIEVPKGRSTLPPKKLKKPSTEEFTQKPSQQKKGPDSYREPIE